MSTLRYPLQINAGDITLTDSEPRILADAIASAVRTRVGERVLRPDYGRTLEPFNSVANLGVVSQSIRNTVVNSCEDYTYQDLTIGSFYGNDGQVTVEVGFTTSDLEPITVQTSI